MSAEMVKIIEKKLREAQDVFSKEESFPESLLSHLSRRLLVCFEAGGKIAFIGNGGSASEATHIAAEFVGKCVIEHAPLAAISLTDSNAILTALSNDYGVDEVFTRQVNALMKNGDILVALSTSGKSPNILKAIESANEIGVHTVLWMGDFENESEAVEVWNVPSKSTPRIQEVHLMWGHVLAQVIEEMI